MHFDWQSFIDWVQLVSALGTVVATGLAAYSIRQSSRQARENTALVISERRRDVQLDAVQRLGEALATPTYNMPQIWERRRLVRVQLAVIDAPMPVCRARFESTLPADTNAALGTPPDTPEDAIDGATNSEGLSTMDRMVDEVVDAVRALGK